MTLILGWAMGVAAAPSWRTFLGGAVLLGAVVMVVASQAQAKSQSEGGGGGGGGGGERAEGRIDGGGDASS